MPLALHIDQERTFKTLVFLSSAPRMAFGSDRQDVTKGGTPKWEVQVAATIEHFGGRTESEILRVWVVSATDPGESLGGPCLVEMVGLRARFHVIDRPGDKAAGERAAGFTVSYQADAVRPKVLPDPA